MAVSKKQQQAVDRYISKHYDHIAIRVPKGERDRYKALAARVGVSVNQLFVQAVERYIEDNIDELGTLPETAEDSGEH